MQYTHCQKEKKNKSNMRDVSVDISSVAKARTDISSVSK